MKINTRRTNVVISGTMAHGFFKLLDRNVFELFFVDKHISFGAESKTVHIKTGLPAPRLSEYEIDMHLVHDHDQYYNLRQAGINTPTIYATPVTSDLYTLLHSAKPYIFKSYYAARSLGKHVFKKHHFLAILTDSKRLTPKEFNKAWGVDPGQTISDDEKNILIGALRKDNVYVQDYINIKHEFRVLYFRGCANMEPVIIARKGYGPNNTETRSSETTERIINNELTDEIMDVLYKFGDAQPSPMLSFDVYIGTDDKWGVLEYSTEFGYVTEGLAEQILPYFNKAILTEINNMPDFNVE